MRIQNRSKSTDWNTPQTAKPLRHLTSAAAVVSALPADRAAAFTTKRGPGNGWIGSVRRTDNLISSALRLVDCGAWSTADFMDWRHSASDRRLDCKSDHGSLWLGTSSPPIPYGTGRG